MFLVDLLFAFVVALLLSMLFIPLTGPQRAQDGGSAVGAMLFFFLILFLASWAGGLWITPLGPPLWGAYWAPVLLVGVFLDDEAIQNHPIAVREMTRENLIVFEESSEQQFRFGMPGTPLSDEEIRSCLDRLQAIDPPPEYLVLSGSLPPGVDESLYARVAESMGAVCRIVLDTSGRPLRLALESLVYLIKPNMRELAQLAGRAIEDETQIREVAQALIRDGQAQVVATSLGSSGAVLTTADEHRHIRSPTVKIRSKVGAGDSMVAGMVLAISQGKTVLESARFGVAAGAAAVMTEGTELCRREDVEQLYQEMMEPPNP